MTTWYDLLMNETTKMTSLGIIAGITLGLAAGLMIGHSQGVEQERNADITVLPCSAYEDPHLKIPAHTFTAACMTEDGQLSLPENIDK